MENCPGVGFCKVGFLCTRKGGAHPKNLLRTKKTKNMEENQESSEVQNVDISSLFDGPFLVLPSRNPNFPLSKISLTMRDWAKLIVFQSEDDLHKAPKGESFPHVLKFTSNGMPLYIIETQKKYTTLNLQINSPLATIDELKNHAAQLVREINGPTAAADSAVLEEKLEFEAFVITNSESNFHKVVDKSCAPTLEQWPYACAEPLHPNFDASVPYFLENEVGEPIKAERSMLSKHGRLAFQLRIRKSALSSNAVEGHKKVRLAIRPVSETLARLKGWTLITEAFEIKSQVANKRLAGKRARRS